MYEQNFNAHFQVFVPLLKDSAGTVGNHHFLTALLDFLSTALEVELYNIVLKEYLEIEVKSLLDIQ